MSVNDSALAALSRLRPHLRADHFAKMVSRFGGDAAAMPAFTAAESPEHVIRVLRNGYVADGETAKLSNVQAAYRQLCREASESIEPYPQGRYSGRGIVMAGGGSYFAALYVSLRMIRHVGCTLPIEVWHLGNREMLPWQRKLLEPLDVTTVDAHDPKWPIRPTGGWPLKPFAVVNSRFEDVLFLDADCYHARDPAYLFDSSELAEAEAIFWPDRYDVKPFAFEALGVQPGGSRPVESGQFYVRKSAIWRELNLALWMNSPQHHKYYYSLFWGDKESYRFAWQLLGRKMAMPAKDYGVAMPAMLGHDLAGEVLFVHRCCGKFTLADKNTFVTNTSPSVRNDSLPREAEAWGFLEELRSARGRVMGSLTAIPPEGADCGCGKK